MACPRRIWELDKPIAGETVSLSFRLDMKELLVDKPHTSSGALFQKI